MKTRILLKDNTTCYHCMTRTVHGERWLSEVERDMLRRMLVKVADFSGVKVITFCLMGNHFHLLVEVPPERERETIDDPELARRYRLLYGDRTQRRFGQLTADEVDKVLTEGGMVAETLREQLKARMHDLSIFMETLKSRFTRWFNRRHETFGTLWAGRFKSVIVERDAAILKQVAAYIDLNPVRAGLVSDPAAYPHSGFGEAWRGRCAAREALESWAGVVREGSFKEYAAWVYARGSVSAGAGKGGFIPPEIVKANLAELGAVVAGCKGGFDVRFGEVACRAVMMGNLDFLETHAPNLARLLGRKRRPCFRPVDGIEAAEAQGAEPDVFFWNQAVS